MRTSTAAPDGLVVAQPARDPGPRHTAGFELQLQQRGGGTVEDLAAVGPAVRGRGAGPAIRDPRSVRVTLPQVFVDLDREKAKMMGVKVASVFEALQTYFGSLYVNDFTTFGRVWRVQVQAEAGAATSPGRRPHLRAQRDGELVPLSGWSTPASASGPTSSRASTASRRCRSTARRPGVSSGAAMEAHRRSPARSCPHGYGFDGAAKRTRIEAGNQAPFVLLSAW